MIIKKFASLIILFAAVAIVAAQDATSQSATAQPSPTSAQDAEEKAKLEKRAVALLEQVITDSQGLRLPENKIRVQIAAGDMLWAKNPARARGLLTDAGAMLGQMMLEVDRTALSLDQRIIEWRVSRCDTRHLHYANDQT